MSPSRSPKKRYSGKSYPLHNIPDLEESMKKSILKAQDPTSLKLVVILFASPRDPFSIANIIPKINYVNHRSSDTVDFFYSGMIPELNKEDYMSEELVKMPKVGNEQWYFSDFAFTSMLSYFEKSINWKYSGGADLIIFNYMLYENKVHFIWDNALILDLEKAIEKKAIRSASSIIESIITFSGGDARTNPVESFAAKQMGGMLKGQLLRIAASFLPKELAESLISFNVFIPLDVKKRN
jgi:hypothetical protein